MAARNPWGETEWKQRRKDFMAEGQNATDILQFHQTNNSLDKEVDRTRRNVMVQHLLACVGLGKHDDPRGRRAAYLDAILPLDYKDKDKGESSNRTQQVSMGCPSNSSCGTFIRAAWQLMGAGDMSLFAGAPPDPKRLDPKLRQSYDGDAFLSIAQWAYNCGALHGEYSFKDFVTKLGNTPLTPDDPNVWQPGDVVFVREDKVKEPAQHIFTVINSVPQPADISHKSGSWAVNTVDGGKGMVDTDSICMGIMASNRTVYNTTVGPTQRIIVELTKTPYTVHWWVDFSKVRFSDPEYFFARRGPNHPKTKAPSWASKVPGGF